MNRYWLGAGLVAFAVSLIFYFAPNPDIGSGIGIDIAGVICLIKAFWGKESDED
jgi:hypothetical protein